MRPYKLILNKAIDFYVDTIYLITITALVMYKSWLIKYMLCDMLWYAYSFVS